MTKSIFNSCNKKEIDEITTKARNILQSGFKYALMHEQVYNEERQKNKSYKIKYNINDADEKQLLLQYLKPQNIADVQEDDKLEKNRHGNRMYIFIINPKLTWVENEQEITASVETYLKIELIQIIKKGKIVLLISLHEPENGGIKPRYCDLKC